MSWKSITRAVSKPFQQAEQAVSKAVTQIPVTKKQAEKAAAIAVAIPTGGLSLAKNKSQAIKIAGAEAVLVGGALAISALAGPATASMGVSGSGLGGASGTVGGFAAPGAAGTVATSSIPTTAGGIWGGVTEIGKAIGGTIKVAGDALGAIVSGKVIVDALTGKQKTIETSQQIPPGWTIDNSAPGVAAPGGATAPGVAGAPQDIQGGQGAASSLIPLALVAAVAVVSLRA